MKIWILTGDKMETAENIAISSGLFKKVNLYFILLKNREIHLKLKESHLLKIFL